MIRRGLACLFLAAAVGRTEAQLFTPGLYVGHLGQHPGQILALDLRGKEPKVKVAYNRSPLPSKENKQPYRHLSSFAFDRHGTAYLASGVDRFIYKVVESKKAEFPSEILFVDHPGAIKQVREVAVDDKAEVLYYSVVGTPQDNDPLADGEIWQVPLTGKAVPKLYRKVAQKEVGHDWWGNLSVSGDRIFVATSRAPASIYRVHKGQALELVHKIDPKYKGDVRAFAVSGPHHSNVHFTDGKQSLYFVENFGPPRLVARVEAKYELTGVAFRKSAVK